MSASWCRERSCGAPGRRRRAPGRARSSSAQARRRRASSRCRRPSARLPWRRCCRRPAFRGLRCGRPGFGLRAQKQPEQTFAARAGARPGSRQNRQARSSLSAEERIDPPTSRTRDAAMDSPRLTGEAYFPARCGRSQSGSVSLTLHKQASHYKECMPARRVQDGRGDRGGQSEAFSAGRRWSRSR